MTIAVTSNTWIKHIARAGLIAKGVVYTLLGLLAFLAAFEMGGQDNDDASRSGVFRFIKESPGGVLLLGLLAAGLICYSIWRVIQTFAGSGQGEEKKWTKRLRYFFSGLTYLSVAFAAIQMEFRDKGNGDTNEHMAVQLMNKPYGQWLVGIGALIMAAIGIYQIWYGLSEKYKEHVQGLNLRAQASSLLLGSGKVGYAARGIVWLIIAYLLLRAALHANAREAGGTGKAFQFIEASSLGSYLLGALGIGLIAYGVFNFIRARYERFE